MAKLTEGNALYLYRLLRDELGAGRQTPVARVEEVLAADGIAPADVGCSDVAELLGKLDAFVRLTTFKKGRLYATIVANDPMDRALEKAGDADPAEKGAKNGKPWKRKRGPKSVRPTKPRHIEPKAQKPAKAEPSPTEKNAEVEAETTESVEAPIASEATAAETTAVESLAAESTTIPAQQAEAVADSMTAADANTDAVATPEPEAADSATTVEAPATTEEPDAPAATAESVAATAPEPEPAKPSITLNITYDPYEGAEDGLLDPAPENDMPGPEPNPRVEAPRADATPTMPTHATAATQGAPGAAAGAATPVAAASRVPAGSPVAAAPHADAEPAAPAELAEAAEPRPQAIPVRLQSDLPQDFSAEVHCKDELLNMLYRILPLDEDVMALLDEDWRVARSTGSLSGTRSKVSFPLRYLREDGSTPVEVTLRRTTKPTAGKRWNLAYVDGDDGTGSLHEAAGLEGLPKADEGAWSDLSGRRNGAATKSPARELAQFAVIGSWDAFLGSLATMCAPERWNLPDEGVGKPSRYGVLREYVCVTFARVMAEDKLAVAADGSLAAFNTGLLTPFYQDVIACFEPRKGDIAWQFAGFATAGSGELGARVAAAFDPLPQVPDYLRGLGDVAPERNRLAILDTDALLGRQLGRLPLAFLAEGLESNPNASRLVAELGRADATRRGEALTELARAIKQDPGSYRRLGRDLEDACELALRRCRASYRVAAPAWDPATGEMRLLVPMALLDDARADCALVLAPQPSGNYRGVAVMSLARAYVCARVVSAEQPAWLAADVALA